MEQEKYDVVVIGSGIGGDLVRIKNAEGGIKENSKTKTLEDFIAGIDKM